jgi:hypothetical protein
MVRCWGRLVVLMAVTGAQASAAPAPCLGRFLDYQPKIEKLVSDEGGSRRPASIVKVVERNAAGSLTAEIDVTDAFGEPGKPLPLQIELQPPALSDQLFVAITGIPNQFAVSPGVRSGFGWLLMAKELKSLTITAPDSFDGRFPISVQLFDKEHKVAATGTAFISIRGGKAARPSAGAISAAQMAQAPMPSSSRPVPEDQGESASSAPEDEAAELARADKLMKSGDISAARLVLETLSDQGSGKAAHALGLTFDPIFFKSNFIRGMAPDPAKAEFWYKKAVELGYRDAGSSISKLQVNR